MIMTSKLVGRERECQELHRVMESDRSEFVIVYGRRRVGKTFLVDQYYHGQYDFTVSVSAMLVYTCQKNIAQAFILERYFFVSICPAAIPGTCLSVFLAAVLPLC